MLVIGLVSLLLVRPLYAAAFRFDCFSLLPDGGDDHANSQPVSNATFQQQLDHNNDTAGQFRQFFMWTTEFWKGPGSPIILFTPGEDNATGYTSYLTTRTSVGVLAERLKAAIVILEHRYWGFSSPFTNQTAENLQYLTVDNGMRDLINFAKTVSLPFDNDSHPDQVPWILVGGSYPGALIAWTEHLYPGTFWTYWASSAPVQARVDFWEYYKAARLHMPTNCSRDAADVIQYIDHILMNGTAEDKRVLRSRFGLADLEHDDDFAAVLYNGPGSWQAMQLFTGYSPFYRWCDAMEAGLSNVAHGQDRLEGALEGYASFIKTYIVRGHCQRLGYSDFEGQDNVQCFNTHNASNPMYTDITTSNAFQRTWYWLLCNEPLGWFHGGPPLGYTSSYLVSKLLRPGYFIRQCSMMFPSDSGSATFGLGKGLSEARVNQRMLGWEAHNSTRLLYVTGDRDPWTVASVSSSFRPGGQLQRTNEVPVIQVPGGFHTSDLATENGEVNAEVKEAIDRAIQQMVDWVEEWPGSRREV